MKPDNTNAPKIPGLILASSSPRRREFLEALGLAFTVVPPLHPPLSNDHISKDVNQTELDETPLPGEAPAALVQRLSRLKARTVVANLPSLIPRASWTMSGSDEKGNLISSNAPEKAVIIAADTVVVLDGEILGKPAHPAEATHMLKRLRGRYHYVYSGLTITTPLQISPVSWPPFQERPPEVTLITRLHQSKVWMRHYSDDELAAYVASGDPLDKAGAYGIQNSAFAPVARLEGCFASVMGLPLGELAAAFKEIDLSLPEIAVRCTRYTGWPCCQEQITK